MSTSVDDGWRESSRTPRCAPARRRTRLVVPARAPDLATQRERLPELDPDNGPRFCFPAHLQHPAQNAVDAKPRVPEAKAATEWLGEEGADAGHGLDHLFLLIVAPAIAGEWGIAWQDPMPTLSPRSVIQWAFQ
jgi:hypothetical protein